MDLDTPPTHPPPSSSHCQAFILKYLGGSSLTRGAICNVREFQSRGGQYLEILKAFRLVVFGKCVPFNQAEFERVANLSCKRGEKSPAKQRVTIYGRKPVRHSSHYWTARPVYSGMRDSVQIKVHYDRQPFISLALCI